MYLLKRRYKPACLTKSIDLHSTMYLLKLAEHKSFNFTDKFTFHYVSIKTATHDMKSLSGDAFTFHYVSIKTKKMSYCLFSFCNLHSTMYLLKQEIRR